MCKERFAREAFSPATLAEVAQAVERERARPAT
jgi:hypothetical protein